MHLLYPMLFTTLSNIMSRTISPFHHNQCSRHLNGKSEYVYIMDLKDEVSYEPFSQTNKLHISHSYRGSYFAKRQGYHLHHYQFTLISIHIIYASFFFHHILIQFIRHLIPRIQILSLKQLKKMISHKNKIIKMSSTESESENQLYIALPQSQSQPWQLHEDVDIGTFLGKDFDMLAISPTLGMAVINYAWEQPKYHENEYIHSACPEYPEVYGPVIIFGPEDDILRLHNDPKLLGTSLYHDLNMRKRWLEIAPSFLDKGPVLLTKFR